MDPSNPNFDQFIESMIPRENDIMKVLQEEMILDKNEINKKAIIKPVLCTIL